MRGSERYNLHGLKCSPGKPRGTSYIIPNTPAHSHAPSPWNKTTVLSSEIPPHRADCYGCGIPQTWDDIFIVKRTSVSQSIRNLPFPNQICMLVDVPGVKAYWLLRKCNHRPAGEQRGAARWKNTPRGIER